MLLDENADKRLCVRLALPKLYHRCENNNTKEVLVVYVITSVNNMGARKNQERARGTSMRVPFFLAHILLTGACYAGCVITNI